ncbi:hypothetical protein C3432_23600 [Citrobacter amalonaticus]|uniref:Uncharacterized protein n=1 Tax=Citrobacter amalonaticus TaxID=35703 RepID=A0A2S4S137_CITAM|nr:hypothetical protein C3432_23600 [Citrobacter amalonaticus]POT77118.1 hypothetical protein C3436_06695 [Citrobacter amalonaticus]POU67569.1 hypothetical protein C3430_00230 [Citrobacter amalonaticus]POV07174.1 hypothetical protein C3424_00240 [Citrobacter amalonaticus]
MKRFLYFLVYLILFIIGFTLLKYANVLDFNTAARGEVASKFIIMIIVLLAITRWGCKAYIRLTGYKEQ